MRARVPEGGESKPDSCSRVKYIVDPMHRRAKANRASPSKHTQEQTNLRSSLAV